MMSILLDVLMFILITLVFFVRGKVFGGAFISVTNFVPVIGIIIISLCFLKEKFKFFKIPSYINYLFIFIIIGGLLNVYFTVYPFSELRFILEYLMSYIVYVAIFSYIMCKKSIREIYSGLVYGSLFGAIPILLLSTYQSTIRRIGTGETDLPTSVGLLGPSLAIACIVSLLMLIQKDDNLQKNKLFSRYFLIPIFFASLAATILSGSKTAIGGLIFSLAFIVLLNSKYRFRVIISSILLMVVVYFFAINNFDKYSHLLSRFTIDRLMLGFHQRYISLAKAFQGIHLSDLLIGQGYRYELINSIDPINYPHNFLLSNLLHVGFIPFMIFIYAFIKHYYFFFKEFFLNKDYKVFVLATFFSYNIIFINIMFSGRITRIIAIFIFFSITDILINKKFKKNKFAR